MWVDQQRIFWIQVYDTRIYFFFENKHVAPRCPAAQFQTLVAVVPFHRVDKLSAQLLRVVGPYDLVIVHVKPSHAIVGRAVHGGVDDGQLQYHRRSSYGVSYYRETPKRREDHLHRASRNWSRVRGLIPYFSKHRKLLSLSLLQLTGWVYYGRVTRSMRRFVQRT